MIVDFEHTALVDLAGLAVLAWVRPGVPEGRIMATRNATGGPPNCRRCRVAIDQHVKIILEDINV